jgi:hypothetical protein
VKTIMLKSLLACALAAACVFCATAENAAQPSWQERYFPPPNGGLLVFAILSDGNPACASYNGRQCLWGVPLSQINFGRLMPLVCGADHRSKWGVTGFEDPNHWCNLALSR